MKRKVIKQGHNTLTITLPSSWAKKLNLQAGEEIDLKEIDNNLFLSANPIKEKKSIKIDLNDMDIPTIWKYFMAVYREGYDEIIINYNPEKLYDSPYKFFSQHSSDLKYERIKLAPYELVEEITRRFIGLEVVEQHRDHCLIKDMAETSSKEFDSSMRRVFLLVQQMGEELLSATEKKSISIIKHLHDVDINVDKFHDYCIRIMNKTLFQGQQKNSLYFTTLYLLEMLGDEFKNVANHIIKEEKEIKFENLKPLVERVLEQFNSYYELFYKFDKTKAIKMSQVDMDVYYYLPTLYKKKKKKNTLTDSELEIFNHLRRITRYINALMELRIEIEFLKF